MPPTTGRAIYLFVLHPPGLIHEAFIHQGLDIKAVPHYVLLLLTVLLVLLGGRLAVLQGVEGSEGVLQVPQLRLMGGLHARVQILGQIENL